jgi:hypothetical protein
MGDMFNNPERDVIAQNYKDVSRNYGSCRCHLDGSELEESGGGGPDFVVVGRGGAGDERRRPKVCTESSWAAQPDGARTEKCGEQQREQ